ncbi:sporulation protein [Salisaeta longa]|uniref:sporulation protein n=1 Tax=Salisaeta longa TaxID=503170 RepID=UPI0003B3D149|nr:sporulation protein [Salisaeta longa]
MKKLLASIGIGNATVDTVLSSTTVRPGDVVDAAIHIKGGNAEQEVHYIELELETRYRDEVGDGEAYVDATLATYRLTDGFTITPGMDKTLSAEIEIPHHTPLTMGDARVWVETDLEVPMAIDPSDKDPLTVQPTPTMQAVFDGAEALGLAFRKADCEADPYSRYVSGRSFVQEFTFRPSRGSTFAGRLDEVEFIFAPSANSLQVFVEVDRRGGFLSEAFDSDEHKTGFTLRTADAREARSHLESAIQQAL